MKTITMPSFADDKSCLLYVYTDSCKIHQSWLLPDDRVICYENIPENYPSGSICIWDSFDDYVNAIADVDWLNYEGYIMSCSEDLEDVGYPFAFLEEDEEDAEYLQAPVERED